MHFTIFLIATACQGSGFLSLSLWPVRAALPPTKSVLRPRVEACQRTAAAGTFMSMNRVMAHLHAFSDLPFGNHIPLWTYRYRLSLKQSLLLCNPILAPPPSIKPLPSVFHCSPPCCTPSPLPSVNDLRPRIRFLIWLETFLK